MPSPFEKIKKKKVKDGQAGREGERERVGGEQSDGPAACYSTGPGSPLQSGWRPETEGTERLLSSNNTGKKKTKAGTDFLSNKEGKKGPNTLEDASIQQ